MKLQDHKSRTVDLKLEKEHKSKPGVNPVYKFHVFLQPFLNAFNCSKTMVQRTEDFSTLVETSLKLKELWYEFFLND